MRSVSLPHTDVSVQVCLISEPFVVVAFVDVLCHGDLIEKLKLLYKMHVIPGERTGLISRSGDY